MFLKLFNSQCLACLDLRFFAAFTQIAKAKKQVFTTMNAIQRYSQLLAKGATVFHIEIAAILLANTKKLRKFHHFEPVQNLLSFFYLKFIFFYLFLIGFCCWAGIQYLNCKEDASPNRELASPHRGLASPIKISTSLLPRFQRSLH